MDHTQDLYSILGVAPGATGQEIKERYRDISQRLAPGINTNKGAELQFTELEAAYQILGNDQQRRTYDSLRTRLVPDPQFFSTPTLLSRQVIPLMGEPQVLYALLQIIPNKDLESAKKKSTPLNLVVALDRSKSMRGPRLDRVKVAAHQIIDQLGEEDFLSLVTFSDKADVVISSQAVRDRAAMKAAVNLMSADGGTEIFQGLSAAMEQVVYNSGSDYVNHIILLTDGKTYDDESLSLELADTAAVRGIGISTMGIGDTWNDVFLDEIATKTGGSCAYINSPNAVVRFLNERVRSLGSAFLERLNISLAPDPDVKIETVFKLTPNPSPLDISDQPLLLGSLENSRQVKLLIQMQIPSNLSPGRRSILRVRATGDVLQFKRPQYKVFADVFIQADTNPPAEEPPRAILEALGKLTLYRMQQKAEQAIKEGRFDEATRKLQNLATRLMEAGQPELAQTALIEANRVRDTHALSPEGQKTMKFGTRHLINPDDNHGEGDAQV